MLTAQKICKKFGNITALNNVSFKLKTGEITALLGKNGAGKSTLLKILSSYTDTDSGNIYLDDLNASKKHVEYLNHIGYVPENTAIYAEISVFDFLQFTAESRGIFSAQINRKITETSENLGLTEVLAQKCDTLSKGYKKRVAIAAALLANPTVLLLDEPTEGLDPLQKQTLYNMLKKLAKNHIVLISTHLMEDVEAIADRILLLDEGILRSDTSLTEFKKTSKAGLTEAFKIATKG